MVWVGCFEKLFEVIGGLSRLVLRIELGSGDELLLEVTDVLVVLALVAAGGDCDPLWSLLRPSLVASSTTPCTIVCCLDWCPRQLLGAALVLLCMKTSLTASSKEACLVAISRSSFVIFGWSRPSSCTRVG
jgi:hypothetical protein